MYCVLFAVFSLDLLSLCAELKIAYGHLTSGIVVC